MLNYSLSLTRQVHVIDVDMTSEEEEAEVSEEVDDGRGWIYCWKVPLVPTGKENYCIVKVGKTKGNELLLRLYVERLAWSKITSSFAKIPYLSTPYTKSKSVDEFLDLDDKKAADTQIETDLGFLAWDEPECELTYAGNLPTPS